MSSSHRLFVARICYLVGCSVLSLGCASVFGMLLLGEWINYSFLQRVLQISLIAIHAIGSILLLVMLCFRFRLRLDAANLSIFLVFQLAGAVLFTLFNSRFPCTRAFGSEANCRIATISVSIGSGALTGLLIIYGVAIFLISRYRAKTMRKTIEPDEKQRWKQPGSALHTPQSKRLSLKSTVSQESFFTPNIPNQSLPSPGHMQLPSEQGLQRPDSPSSIYSTSTSTHGAHKGANFDHMRPAPPLPAHPRPVTPSSSMSGARTIPGTYAAQGLSLASIPPRLRSENFRPGSPITLPSRTPSPTLSNSSHGSHRSSTFLLPRGPQPLPPQGYRSQTPVPYYPGRKIVTPPPIWSPPASQAYSRYSQSTIYPQTPQSFYPDRMVSSPHPAAREPFVPVALRPGRPLGRPSSPSVRSPPATPVPQDVDESDDLPVITPYDGIAPYNPLVGRKG